LPCFPLSGAHRQFISAIIPACGLPRTSLTQPRCVVILIYFNCCASGPREGLRLAIVERSGRRRVYRATMNANVQYPDITWVLLRTVEHLETSAERLRKTEVSLDKLGANFERDVATLEKSKHTLAVLDLRLRQLPVASNGSAPPHERLCQGHADVADC
jgi:exonuclease VII small subunit